MRINLFAVLYVWIIKRLTLPRCYYNIWQQCRSVSVSFLRDFEKKLLRIEKLKLDLSFLKTCQDLDVFPRFLNFRTPPQLNLDCKSVKRRALKQEILAKNRELIRCRHAATQSEDYIKSKITFFKFTLLKSLLHKLISKCRRKWKGTLDHKLFNIWVTQRPRSPDSLINDSDHKLSIQEENALRYGLNHHIPPSFVNRLAILTSFEKFAHSLNIPHRLFYQRLQHTANSYVYTASNETNTSSNKALHRTLRGLRSNEKIKVCRFDKGSGTVILNSDAYYTKLDSIILTEKFEQVPVQDQAHHPVLKSQNSLQYYLNRYIKPHVSEEIYRKIYPSGGQPGAVYGLVKVHKLGKPLRPVICMRNTPQYELARYLDRVIKPVIPDAHMLPSTKSFLDKISNIDLHGKKLVSFDVVSLFTNVPLQEVIDKACDYVYRDDSTSKPSYDRVHFKKLLHFATSGLFLYKDDVYRQTDGVAMGSPLGPTLANLFLASMESDWLSNANAPIHYFRYVDDIFAIFDANHDTSELFLSFLNSRHQNLKFTMESGPSTLAFLDTHITISDTGKDISVYRKPTHTGLLMNFSSYSPKQWKRSLIYCMLHRAHSICSSFTTLNQEFIFLCKMFTDNGYPQRLFYSVVQKFITNLNNPRHTTNASVDNKHCLIVPYFGQASEILKKRIKSLCSKYEVDAKVIFKPFKVANYFSLKTRCPKPLKSNVVYQFTCSGDQNVSYIGKTKRHLVSRIREHLSPTSNSAVFEHVATCNCPCTADNFNILATCSSPLELSIAEAIHIRELKPSLNVSLHNQGQSFFLKL